MMEYISIFLLSLTVSITILWFIITTQISLDLMDRIGDSRKSLDKQISLDLMDRIGDSKKSLDTQISLDLKDKIEESKKLLDKQKSLDLMDRVEESRKSLAIQKIWMLLWMTVFLLFSILWIMHIVIALLPLIS